MSAKVTSCTPSPVASARGRVRRLIALHGPGDPRVAAARHDLALANLAAAFERLSAEAARLCAAESAAREAGDNT